ncbi:MBL fold metallo-hydrolase [Clostridioides difficile]|uniref:MBL fold metallo-hydrolase n=1 Tax=Clostridioides difficile TaxID=1496 RepID=UPI003080E377
MFKVFENLYLIENEMGANVYLINNGKSFDLIDTAMFMETDKLIAKIEDGGFHIENLNKIILTHCHCDHIGGAAELVKRTGAKVAAHTKDIPYILHEKVIDGSYHYMMIQEQAYMKQYNCVLEKVDIVLSDKNIIDTLGGLEVIHVPGHTPGSIALYQSENQIMFFGDVIRNKHNKGLVIGVPDKFNYDTNQTIQDAQHLMEYPIKYAVFGHGIPLTENVERLLITARTPEEVKASRKKSKTHRKLAKAE